MKSRTRVENFKLSIVGNKPFPGAQSFIWKEFDLQARQKPCKIMPFHYEFYERLCTRNRFQTSKINSDMAY